MISLFHQDNLKLIDVKVEASNNFRMKGMRSEETCQYIESYPHSTIYCTLNYIVKIVVFIQINIHFGPTTYNTVYLFDKLYYSLKMDTNMLDFQTSSSNFKPFWFTRNYFNIHTQSLPQLFAFIPWSFKSNEYVAIHTCRLRFLGRLVLWLPKDQSSVVLQLFVLVKSRPPTFSFC